MNPVSKMKQIEGTFIKALMEGKITPEEFVGLEFTTKIGKTVKEQVLLLSSQVDFNTMIEHITEMLREKHYTDYIKYVKKANIEKIKEYIDFVKITKQKETLIALRQLVQNEPTDIYDYLVQLEELVAKLHKYTITGNDVVGNEIVEDALQMAEQFENKQGMMPTFLEQLNKKLGGGYAKTGALYVLAGDTGSGKTTFAVQLATWFLYTQPNIKIKYYSLEMTPAEIGLKFLLSAGYFFNVYEKKNFKITTTYKGWRYALQEGILQRKYLNEIKQYILKTRPDMLSNFTIPKEYNFSIDKILADARRSLEDDKHMILFIDHLQILSGTNDDKTLEGTIRNITRSLREFSLHTGSTVFLLSQFNRGRQLKKCKNITEDNGLENLPNLHDLKGSSAIEQDAEAVTLLYNHTRRWLMCQENAEPEKNLRHRVYFKIPKNRYGPVGAVQEWWDDNLGLFVPSENIKQK